MTKTHLILAIAAAASIVSIMVPGIIEHLGQSLHFATIVISGSHIIDEISHINKPQRL